MEHPILKDRNRMLIYFSLWIAVAVFQFAFLRPDFPSHPFLIGFSSWFQNLFLGTILLSGWYGLRYLRWETQKPIQFIANHLMYMVIFSFLWITICNIFDRIVLDDILLDYKIRIRPLRNILCLFSYLLFVAFMYLDSYYTSFQEKMDNERRLQEIVKEAELNLLKTQMNPHFIFNSLNSISSLTLLNPEKAQEMIIRLSDFLRYTVSSTKIQKVTLKKELEMCKAYLDIEKIRFGNKIILQIKESEGTEDYLIPAMILQTLFENALKHGIYNSLKPETLFFSTDLVDNRLLIKIENTFDPESQIKKGTGTGLKNVRDRLDLLYDKNALMDTEILENCFKVTLNLPAQTHEN
ncbi:sensor histidine kinase [Leadbetterella byssophila]|uniref:sensor histidine kinase n=1 Tax=Leadbetterella byssophila TaxID=316068 RepID=UPI0039A36168